MHVRDLTETDVPSGTHIRVTHVATDGGHDDTAALLGRTGAVKRLFQPGSEFVSLWVAWDGSRSTLSLNGDDRIEIVRSWRCPNGCDNPQPAWWPAPHGGKTPPCSNCDAPLEIGQAS